MGIITTREKMIYHRRENQNDKLAEALSSVKFNSTDKNSLQKEIYQIMMRKNCVNLDFIERIKKSKNIEEAYFTIYNYILSKEGDGTIKGFTVGKSPFKGTAIRGMEVHSPRL